MKTNFAKPAEYHSEQNARTAIDAYSGIYDIMYKETSISSVGIYSSNETISDYSYFHPVTKEVLQSSWYDRAVSTASVFWQTYSCYDQQKNIYWELVLYRKIPLVDCHTAYQIFLQERIYH